MVLQENMTSSGRRLLHRFYSQVWVGELPNAEVSALQLNS